MTKIILESIFVIFIIVEALCMIKLIKKDKPYKVELMHLFITVMYSTIVNLLLFFSKNEIYSQVLNTLYFASIDAIVYFLFCFVKKYNKFKSKYNIGLWIIRGLVLIDATCMFLNIPFGHCFALEKQNFNGVFGISEGFVVKQYIPFKLHVAFNYIIIAIIFINLIIKYITSPKVYRFKYSSVLYAIVVSVVFDALYLILGFPVDLAVLFFCVSVLLVYYASIIYSPRELITQTLTMCVQNMDDGVIFFDNNRELIFKSDGYIKMANYYKNLGLNVQDPYQVWGGELQFDEKIFKNITDQFFEQEAERDGRKYYFSIWFRNLRDKNGKYVGSFYQIHDKSEEEFKNQQQHYLATRDVLTGLYNKNTFYSKVEEFIKFHGTDNYLMIVSDVDNFKIVNDIFGRVKSDIYLMNVANELREKVKDKGIYGRLENDRFALLCPKAIFKEEILNEACNNLSRIEADKYHPIMIHMGIYEIEDLRMPVSAMCDRAQLALQRVKGNYKQRIVWYDEQVRNKYIREQKFISDFRNALQNRQFKIYLQPQINAQGKCQGAEALARWIHPEEGLIHPKEFINLFEKNGLITELDLYIWNLVAEKLSEWKKKGITNKYISVNISPIDLGYINIYEEFSNLVLRYDIEPKNLHLEITESAIIGRFDQQVMLIEKLRKMGFSVEMDDFGSGYSSLNMLKDVLFDVIKIDMEFLQESKFENRSERILEGIISLSKSLKMPVIVEGVENERQYNYLKDLNCDYFQGYYFDKPIEIDDFEKKYL